MLRYFLYWVWISVGLLGATPFVCADPPPDHDTVIIIGDSPNLDVGDPSEDNNSYPDIGDPSENASVVIIGEATNISLDEVLSGSDKLLDPARQELITIHEAKAYVNDKSFPQLFLDCLDNVDSATPLPGEKRKPNYTKMSSQRLSQELARARSKLRGQIGATYSIGKSWLEPDQHKDVVRTGLAKAEERLEGLRKNLQKQVQKDLGRERSACKPDASIMGKANAQLDIALVEYMALAELYSSMVGPFDMSVPYIDISAPKPADRWDGIRTNYIVYVMGGLADRIVYLQPEKRTSHDIPLEISQPLLETERSYTIREFERAAASARLYNLASGRPVTGDPRRQIEWAIRKNLVDYLNAKSEDATPITQLFSFSLLLDPTDPRAELASQQNYSLGKDLDLRRAMLLNVGVDPTPAEFFLASALALRQYNEDVISTFRNEFIHADDYTLEIGLGTRLRALGLNWDDEASFAAVEKRLTKLGDEVDHVAGVFTRAAEEKDPRKIPAEDYELLYSFGYIVAYYDEESEEEKWAYTIPASGRSLSHWGAKRKQDLDLPGGTVLDVISPKNIAIIAASAAIPEAAGAWLTAGLEATALTEFQILVVRAVAQSSIEYVWQSGLEVGEKYLKDDKTPVNWERNVLNSFLLGTFQNVAGTRSQAYMENYARRLSRNSKNPRFRKYLKEVFEEGSPSSEKQFIAARDVYETITEGLMLLEDTSISYAYQAHIENQDVDSSTFLEMLVHGAMARGVIRAKNTTSEYISNFIAKRARKSRLWKELEGDPKFRKEMVDAIELLVVQEAELFQRFSKVVDGTGESAETRFNENMAGEFSWVETKALYAGGKISKEVMTAIGEHRMEFFDKLIFMARVDAIKEVNDNFAAYKEQMIKLTNGNEAKARELALQRQRRELDAINADLKVPGAKTATSDVDRATGSVYLRKHLVSLWDIHARMKNGDAPQTSARAFDVNEYIDVFTFIKENRKYVEALRKTSFTPSENIGGSSMGHSDAMLAIAMSGAMRTMSEPRMEQYIRNRRAWLNGKIEDGIGTEADLTKFDKRARWARKHLLDSRKQLEKIAAEISNGGTPEDPNTILKAKDRLYQTRMEEISRKQWELSYLEENGVENSDNALNLRAEIERLTGIAMRDGIETYTHTVGLDIVVNLVQSKKKKITNLDGTTREVSYKVADRIDDPNFTLKKDLKIYLPHDIEGIVHDQIMFIAEHCHAFSHGLETEYATGRALGKYVERYFLAEKIMGLDINEVRNRPESDPTRRLLDLSQQLAANKSDPKALLEILKNAARKAPSTSRDGIAEMFYLIEMVIPGMKNMTGIKVTPAKGENEPTLPPVPLLGKVVDKVVTELVVNALAEERKEQELIAATSGNEGLIRFLEDRSAALERQRLFEAETLEELIEIAKKYRLKDWKRINELALQIEGQTSLISSMPWQLNPSETYRKFVSDRAETRETLEEVRNEVRDIDIDELLTNDPEMDEYRRVKNRIWWLDEAQQRLKIALQEAGEKARREAVYDQYNFTGNWRCGPAAQPKGELHIKHTGKQFEISMLRTGQPANTSPILMEGRYVHGVFRGRWWDTSQIGEKLHDSLPQVFAGMSFLAESNEAGTTITFKYAPKHPSVDITWTGLACERNGKIPASDNMEYITVVQRSLTPELAEDQYESGTGYLKTRLILPNGEVNNRHVGFRAYGDTAAGGSGSWYYPGEIRLAVEVSQNIETLPVMIVGNGLTEVVVRPGVIEVEEIAPEGAVNSHLEIVKVDDPSTIVFSDFGSNDDVPDIILAPGSYNIIANETGTIEKKNVAVRSGQVTPVTIRWAAVDLVTKSGKAFSVSKLVHRGASEDDIGNMIFMQGSLFQKETSKHLRMPPGSYVVEIYEGNTALKKSFTLEPGETTKISF